MTMHAMRTINIASPFIFHSLLCASRLRTIFSLLSLCFHCLPDEELRCIALPDHHVRPHSTPTLLSSPLEGDDINKAERSLR